MPKVGIPDTQVSNPHVFLSRRVFPDVVLLEGGDKENQPSPWAPVSSTKVGLGVQKL